MNSFSFSESTWPRTTRATYIQNKNDSTRMIVISVPPNFFSAMARIAIAGTTRNRSVMRISSWSVALPANPAIAPTAVPTTVEIRATANPISREIWPA